MNTIDLFLTTNTLEFWVFKFYLISDKKKRQQNIYMFKYRYLNLMKAYQKSKHNEKIQLLWIK